VLTRAVQPLVVRLNHGENPVYRMTSRRQLKFPHHAGMTTDLISVSGVRGPSDTPNVAMAGLITLPSLAMSLMAFSLMASDLRLASRAWLRAVASCSRDARDRSSSAWTFEEQAGTRSQERQKKKKGRTTPKFTTHSGAALMSA
jgi:hypothetical protein